MRLLFLIATRNRPDSLSRLIRQIYWQSPYEAKVLVIDDCSDVNYHKVRKLLRKHDGEYERLEQHQGKREYWRVCNHLFEWAQSQVFDYAFKLDDDIELHPQAIRESVQQFSKIPDPKKTVFNMWVDHRAEQKIWTSISPKTIAVGSRKKLLVRKVGWIDGGNWMANRLFFEALQWRCPKPSKRWMRRSSADSSGVGKFLSVRLQQKACRIYMPMESLIFHGGHQSQMHPHKTDRPIEMDTKPWLDQKS